MGRGWGSANDMTEKDLGVKEAKEVQEEVQDMKGSASRAGNVGWSLANTGKNSTSYLSC